MAQLRRSPVSSKAKKIANPIARAMGRAKHSDFYHELSLRGKHPLKLLGTPEDMWPGSVTAGTQIVSGKMMGGGHVLDNPDQEQNLWSSDDLWQADDLSDRWLEHLHSFNWLRDLNQAVDQAAAKDRAQQLVEDWIDHHTKWGEISWRADIVGQRIANWLVYAPIILDNDDVIYRGRVLDIMARSARHIMKLSDDLPDGPDALKAVIGLILSGLYIPYGEEWLKQGRALLCGMIGKEVLVDGGLRTRNPDELLHLFMSMVQLGEAFSARGQQTPKELEDAIARMASNLKSLLHGDGKFALFHDAIIYNHEDVMAALLKVRLGAVPINNMNQSGFARLERGQSLILMDVGPPAEHDLSRGAHCSSHSFEMSRAAERLIVNCGDATFMDDPYGERWADKSRSSDAHSTLILEHADSCEICEDGLIGSGVTRMVNEKFEQEGHVLLETEHDGYVRRFGFLHKRLIYINETGEDIRGEDIIEHHKMSETCAKTSFIVRFHLHPNVSVSSSSGDDTISLGLASGESWTFYHRGGELAVEDSIYYGNAGKCSPTKQITVSGETSGALTRILWSLKLD